MYSKYITHSVKRQPFYCTKPIRLQVTEATIARRSNWSDIERARLLAALR